MQHVILVNNLKAAIFMGHPIPKAAILSDHINFGFMQFLQGHRFW